MSPASPHLFSWAHNKELRESNQLINQHGPEQGTRGLRGKFRVSAKGKPFSLKNRKEQTRLGHGQTTGCSLCTGLASPRWKRHSLPRNPTCGSVRMAAPGASGRTDHPTQEPEKGPPTRGAKSSRGQLARGPSPAPAEGATDSLTCPGPARAQATEASQSLESPKVEGRGPGRL